MRNKSLMFYQNTFRPIIDPKPVQVKDNQSLTLFEVLIVLIGLAILWLLKNIWFS